MTRAERAIRVVEERPVAWVVFDRVARRNALTRAMWTELARIVADLAADDGVRVLAFRGADASAFAAGADIHEISRVHEDPRAVAEYIAAIEAAETAILDLRKPTIAMIRGWCVGGGAAIAAACDFRFGDETARIGVPPARLGIVYSRRSVRRLVRLVGDEAARLLLFTGRICDADVAAAIGFMAPAVPSAELENVVRELAAELAAGAPSAIAGTKEMLGLVERDDEASLALATALVHASWSSPEARSLVGAFVGRDANGEADRARG